MTGRGRSEAVTCPDVSVQAWFASDDISVAPGETLSVTLTVHNMGPGIETFSIVPAGVRASWLRIQHSSVTLAAGDRKNITVEIEPPLLPTTTSGPTPIGVRIIPSDDPDADLTIDTTIDVGTFEDRRILALQPVQRARRRAVYEFMVDNRGNGLASCRLRLIDPSGRVDGSFDPPAVGVAPGSSSLVQLRSRAKHGFFRRATRTLDFEVHAEQQGIDPAIGHFSFVQPPTLPGAVLGRALMLALILGAAALAWFGVVRPEIRDAADAAVDDRITELEAAEETVPTTSADSEEIDGSDVLTPVTVEDVASEDEPAPEITVPLGEPTFFRLTVAAPLTQAVSDSRTIPDGQLFDMTDVRIENPYNDDGIATLLVNGDPVYFWSLENVRGQYFEPSITPVRLQPGDNITFTVRCDGISDPSRTTCTNAINVGGTARDVDEI